MEYQLQERMHDASHQRESCHNVIPVFEKLILLFKKRSPVVHMLYDSLYNHRLLKASMDMIIASVECRNVKLQLADKEILIGESILKTLRDIMADHQKRALIGM